MNPPKPIHHHNKDISLNAREFKLKYSNIKGDPRIIDCKNQVQFNNIYNVLKNDERGCVPFNNIEPDKNEAGGQKDLSGLAVDKEAVSKKKRVHKTIKINFLQSAD